jgi:hypothetical protein
LVRSFTLDQIQCRCLSSQVSIFSLVLFSPFLPILLILGSGKAFFLLKKLSLKVLVIEFILFLLYLSGIPHGFLLSLLSLPPLLLSPLFPPPPLPNLVIFDLITPHASWNLSLLISLFDSSSVREIQKIKIHPNPVIDLWVPSPNGVFSSRSAYKLIVPIEPSFPPLLLILSLGSFC